MVSAYGHEEYDARPTRPEGVIETFVINSGAHAASRTERKLVSLYPYVAGPNIRRMIWGQGPRAAQPARQTCP